MFLGGVAVAQEYRGTVRGQVRDEDGGVIPGVTVTITNDGNGRIAYDHKQRTW